MAWARYDDMLPMNRKWVAGLRPMGMRGAAALGLHLLANAWSRHNGTGGYIDAAVIDSLVGRDGLKLAGLLVDVGMFDADGDGWRIHDFADFSDPNDPNPDRSAGERRKELIEKRREAGRLGGYAKAASKAGTANNLPVANAWQTSSPVPVPVPDPVLPQVATQLPPPTECPDGGGGAVDNRRDATVAAYASLAVKRSPKPVTNKASYMRSAATSCNADPELTRLLALFPTAPAEHVALWLHGDKGTQAHYLRSDELATIHPFPATGDATA